MPRLGNADNVGASLHFLVQPFQRVRAVDLGSVLLGEVQIDRTSVSLSSMNARASAISAALVRHVTQRLAGLCAIRLDERLAQCRRHHALLGLRYIRQRIPHPMNATALPRGTEHPTDRRLQPLMRVRDHQLHARRPRRARLFRKPDQNVSASDGPMCSPTISRLPSVFTAIAIIAATETIRPPSRCFR